MERPSYYDADGMNTYADELETALDQADSLHAAALVAELQSAEQGLFAAIEHGDAEHRAWLKGMVRGWFAARIADLLRGEP